MKNIDQFAKSFFLFILITAFVFEGTWAVFSVSYANPIEAASKPDSFLIRDQKIQAQSYYLFETTEILQEVEQLKNKKSGQASVILVGDIMLSRTVNDKMRGYQDYFYPFSQLEGFLNSADLTFGNLESPINTGKYTPPSSFTFDADPKTAENLAKAGFDVLSMANNHVGNAGQQGFLKTFELLQENGIKYIGAAKNKTDLDNQGIITDANGIRIGWLAYAYGPSHYGTDGDYPGMALMDIEQMKKDVARLKPQADHVFVSMHAGAEYTEKILDQQKEFAQTAIDFGASLVIGHHPHVAQRFGEYHGGYILYSLGNFVFDQMWSEDTKRGLAAKVYLDKENINRLEYYPIKIQDFAQPRFSFGHDQENIYNRLQTDLGYGLAAVVDGNEIKIAKTAQQSFNATEQKDEKFLSADINKNDIEEYFYLRGDKVYIIEDNKLKWQSFPNWKVNKIFLSDANADGQADLNMILDIDNECRWFIYGWRRGSWQPYWDSSQIYPPISDIEEVEPGKFLILEKQEDSDNLTLWQWDEWGPKLIDEIKDVSFSAIEKAGSGLFLLR